ncbi:MAG: metallophosphoesterase [Defluviitaleaceae bacterium]|nr:metallophosphoesterase [Defluviitaleaceae bacterium]
MKKFVSTAITGIIFLAIILTACGTDEVSDTNAASDTNAGDTYISAAESAQALHEQIDLFINNTARQQNVAIFDYADSDAPIYIRPANIIDTRIDLLEKEGEFNHIPPYTLELWRLDFMLLTDDLETETLRWGTFSPDTYGWVGHHTGWNDARTLLVFSIQNDEPVLLGQIPWYAEERAENLADALNAFFNDEDTAETNENIEPDFSLFNQFHLTILHTNDWHGVLHNVPMFATLVREVREERENVLLLDGGDLYRRGPLEELNGAVEMAIMNAMGYDALVFGNNDFPKTDEELFHVSQHTIVQLADFPVLLGNATLDGEIVEGMEAYIIITKQYVDIAVLGVTSPKPWDREYHFTERYLFEDPVAAVERMTAETADRADIQIVLSHAGFQFDRQMSGVSAVIGGDDHRVVNYVITDGDRRVPVVQAGGERNHFLGQIDLYFAEVDGEWVLFEFYARLLSTDDVAPCPEILGIIEYYTP